MVPYTKCVLKHTNAIRKKLFNGKFISVTKHENEIKKTNHAKYNYNRTKQKHYKSTSTKKYKKKNKKEERDCGTAIHVQLFVLSRIINENHHLLLSLIKYCHVNYAKHTTRMHYQCLIKVSKHVLLLLHNV